MAALVLPVGGAAAQVAPEGEPVQDPQEILEIFTNDADGTLPVFVNMEGDLPSVTQFDQPIPEGSNVEAVAGLLRASVEAQRMQVDAIREQTAAIVAQTTATNRLAAAQEATSSNVAALTAVVETVEFTGTLSIPQEVIDSVIPALDALREWISPSGD
jgi:hypothetical protein